MPRLSARDGLREQRERVLRGRVADLVEVAVHRAALADDPDVDARRGQFGGEGLARRPQAVELGVDDQHLGQAREVMAARERVARGGRGRRAGSCG